MIEPTDEMLTAAFDACEDPATEVEEADLRRMVAAVLALVERDYRLIRRRPNPCGAMSAPIPYYGPVGCELAPGHEFRHFFVTGPGETVEWPDRNADGTYSVGPS